MTEAIDHENHFDYLTYRNGEDRINTRVMAVYDTPAVDRIARRVNRKTNRHIVRAVFDIVNQYMPGHDTDEFFQIARSIIPKGVFDKDLQSDCLVNDLKDVINAYEQGRNAIDPMYRYTKYEEPRSEFHGIIDDRMWLYSPKQTKHMNSRDRLLNSMRVRAFRTIYWIINKYNNADNKDYTWQQMDDECHDYSGEPFPYSYGVIKQETRTNGNAWHVTWNLIQSRFGVRNARQRMAYQKKFRNGGLHVMHHPAIKRYLETVVFPNLKKEGDYSADVWNELHQMANDKRAVTLDMTLHYSQTYEDFPFLTDSVDIKRYLRHAEQPATVK